MVLWVLQYKNSRVSCYVGVGDECVFDKRRAIKFDTKEQAEKFKNENRKLWMYEATEVEFEEKQLEF